MRPELKPLAAQFGKNVREARMNLGLSQEELARDCELSHVMIVRVEAGKRLPSVGTLVKLAAVLDVPAKDLFKGVPRWVPGTDQPGRFVPQEQGQKSGVAELDCMGGDPRPHGAED